MNGKKIHNRTPIEGMKNSIAFLTEDRKKDGLCLGLTVEFNTNMASYPMITRSGLINLKKEKERADKYIKAINIKTPSPKQRCKNLSGGNQQKVVISKWMCRDSEVFIFDEPTVGVDVGAKVEIYKLIEALINEGKAIILISSYLPEVMGLSDEMIVMSEGRQMAILDKSEFYNENGKLNEEKALMLASGLS
jgi:ribose transport system ATP-binding protein